MNRSTMVAGLPASIVQPNMLLVSGAHLGIASVGITPACQNWAGSLMQLLDKVSHRVPFV